MSDIKVGIKIEADGSKAVATLNQVSGSAQSAARNISGGFNDSKRSTDLFNRSLMESKALMAGLSIASAYALKAFTESMVRAGSEIDRMKGMLEAASGSSQKAAANFEFIKDTAWKMGSNLQAATEGFTQLSAAAQGTALQGQATRDIFTSIVQASAALGKSAADTQGMITALGQMMSKGKVSAEELRGQLGERLPGAFNLAAQAMGVTTAQLDDMLQKGQITADDFLPKFARVLDDTYSGARFDRINNEIERLDQTWEQFKRTVIDTEGMASAIRGLSAILKGFVDDLQGSFGLGENGLQASLEKRIAEQKRVIAEMKKAGPLGRLFINDAEIQQRETEVRQMQDRLAQLKKASEQATRDANQAATASAPGGRASTPLGIAQQFQGMTERGNAEALTRFLNEHSGTVFNNLTVPWCARFVNASLDKAGIRGTGSAAARSFETFGKGVWQRGMSKDALADVQPGDIAVFTRKGGGHVGFVKAIDQTKGLLEILGGNQSNSVSVAKRSMQDLLAVRRPPTPGAKGEYEDFDQYQKRAKKAQEDAQRETEKRQRDATQRYLANLDDQAKAAQRQADIAISGIDNQISALDRERDAWDQSQQDKLDAAKGSYDAMARLEAERAATLQDYAARELALIQRQFDARKQAMDAAASAFRKQLDSPNTLTAEEERRAKQGLADVQADLVKLANERAQAEAKAGQAAQDANRGGMELAQKQRAFIANINADLEFQRQLYLQLKAAKEAGATPEGLAVIRATAEQTQTLPGSVSAEQIMAMDRAIAQRKIYEQQTADMMQTEQDRAESVREQQLRENAYWDQLINRMEQYADTWREITGSQNDAFSRLAIQTNQYAKSVDQIGKAYDDLNKTKGDPAGVLGIAEGAAQAQAALNLMAQTMLALRSQYKEGTQGYEDMTAAAERMMEVQRALQLVEAVLGVVHQATAGDVYTAIPRMIGVAAMMASMGLQTGAGGSANASVKYAAQAGQQESGVFGDPSKPSDSIAKALEVIRDNSSNDLNYSAAMLRALEGIEAAMGGVTNTIIRGVQPASVKAGRLSGLGDLDAGGIDPLGRMIGNLIFSTYRRISDFGIQASQQALSAIIKGGFSGQVYTDIETTTKVLGMTVSKSVKTVFEGLDPAIAKQFTLAFQSISTAIVEGGKAFGLTAEDFAQRMRGFIVDMGKISTKDMTGEELQKKITQMFSEQSDRMARRFMPGLGKFQQVGEGYFQTFVRVAEAVNRAGGELERLGIKAISYRNIERKQADVAAEIVRESLLQQTNLTDGVRQYVKELTGSAEDLIDAYKKLKEATQGLRTAGLGINVTRAEINAGGGLDAYTQNLQTYLEKFLTPGENLVGQWQNIGDAFTALGLKMPTTNAEFRQLVEGIDVSTEAGQKLRGAVLALAPGFADLTSAMNDAKNALQSAYDTAKQQVQGLRDYLNSLQTGANANGTLMDRYKAAKALYDKTLADANRGDQAAIDALSGTAQAFLDLSRQMFGSTAAYGQDLANVHAGMGKLATTIEGQVKAAEDQYNWLKNNTAALTSLETAIKNWETTVTTINGIKAGQTGQSVGEANANNNAAAAAARLAAREAEAAAYEKQLANMTSNRRDAISAGQNKLADKIKAKIEDYIARINADSDGYNAYWDSAAKRHVVQLLAKGGPAQPGWAIVGEQGPELVRFQQSAFVHTAAETARLLRAQAMPDWEALARGPIGIPVQARAEGGFTPPGLTLVGERGPELVNFTRPGQVYTAEQTQQALGGLDTQRLEARLEALERAIGAGLKIDQAGYQALRDELQALRAEMTEQTRAQKLMAVKA